MQKYAYINGVRMPYEDAIDYDFDQEEPNNHRGVLQPCRPNVERENQNSVKLILGSGG